MAIGFPDYFVGSFLSSTEMEQQTASVTATETVITFSKSVKSFLIYNDGPNNVYFSDSTGVSTSNFPIRPRSWIFIDVEVIKLYFVCASGESATVYVIGLR